MGIASTAFIKSFVDNIVMPIIRPFVPGGAWETATLQVGPIVLRWGAFLGELINFIIIAFVIFIIAKKVLKEEKVTKNNLYTVGFVLFLIENAIAVFFILTGYTDCLF